MYVRFLVLETGVIVERYIESYYEARKFINKLEHSKKLSLLAFWKPY